MHGMVFGELKKFVDQRLGGDAWATLLAKAGQEGKHYTPVQDYPDQEVVALVSAASLITGIDPKSLLTDFGRFMVPDLLELFHRQIRPEWQMMDLLAHVEDTIHKVVRLRNPGATPPQLRVERLSANQVTIYYASPRKLCSLGIGLIEGISTAYKETLEVHETTCMLRGDACCTIELVCTSNKTPRLYTPIDTVTEAVVHEATGKLPIVIIGTGPIGIQAAREILRQMPGQEVLVYGDEPWEPYNRVRLSELLAGDVEWSEIAMPLEISSTDNISLAINNRVAKIDPAQRYIIDSHGRRQPYSYLILATGAKARPADLHGKSLLGIYTYRDIEDAQKLLTHVVQSESTVILGGGILGIEVAFALKQQNPDAVVTLIHRNHFLMNRELDQNTADFLLLQVKKAGITVIFGTHVTEFIGTTRLERICLSNGESMLCDTIVVCAGIIPNTDLARMAGLGVGQGITVNDYLQTSDPHIYAVGDCVEHRHKIYGTISPGIEQAKIAVSNIKQARSHTYQGTVASMRAKIKHLPVFALTAPAWVYILGWQLFGFVFALTVREPLPQDKKITKITFIDDKKGYFRQLGVHRGRLISASAVGQWEEFSLVQDGVEHKTRIWPWHKWYFTRYGSYAPDSANADPTSLPVSALVCTCAGVTRGDIDTAIAEGCKTVADLSLRTNAGQNCGSCKPLLAQFIGVPKIAYESSQNLPLLLFSLLAIPLALLFLLPKLPVPHSIQAHNSLSLLLFNNFWKQVSGYTALGFGMVFTLLLSLNKHLKLFNFLHYNKWRTLHVTMMVLMLVTVLVHTNLSLGIHLNRQMMLWFFLALFSGVLLSWTILLERSFFGFLARQYRHPLLKLHQTIIAVFVVYLLVHIGAAYYF